MSQINWNLILTGIGAIANAVAAICAAYTIKNTLKEQRRMREDGKKQVISNQKIMWYNDIVFQDIKAALDLFVESTTNIISQIGKEKLYEESNVKLQYDTVCENQKILGEKIMGLKMFHKKLYNDCDDKAQEMLDTYAEIFQIISDKKYIPKYKLPKIQQERLELIELLYQYEEKMIQELLK